MPRCLSWPSYQGCGVAIVTRVATLFRYAFQPTYGATCCFLSFLSGAVCEDDGSIARVGSRRSGGSSLRLCIALLSAAQAQGIEANEAQHLSDDGTSSCLPKSWFRKCGRHVWSAPPWRSLVPDPSTSNQSPTLKATSTFNCEELWTGGDAAKIVSASTTRGWS